MEFNNHIPLRVAAFIRRGSEQTECSAKSAAAHDRLRAMERKWRNLVGEARYDIPEFLWEFVDWRMPTEWHIRERSFVTIDTHRFPVVLPGFLPVYVYYRTAGYNYWEFDKFQIDCSGQVATSKKYKDLAIMLALASEKNPRRQKVVIEEIPGEMTDDTVLKPWAINWQSEMTGEELDYTGYGIA